MRAIPVTAPIDRILNAFLQIFNNIFRYNGTGYLYQLMATIMSQPLLILGCVLLLCGFVIGILKRIITM